MELDTSTLVGFWDMCVGSASGWGTWDWQGQLLWTNVALGMEGVTEEMVGEGCRAALFNEFMRDLSDGYESIIGGGGSVVGSSRGWLLRGQG